MSRAEQIISTRIKAIQARMDWELDAQIEAEDEQDTSFDMAASDRYWHELFSMKIELMRVLAEIQEVDKVTDIVLE